MASPARALTPGTSWLAVIDMQNAFLAPDVPWSTGANGLAIVPRVRALAQRWGPERTIFTRYIAREGTGFAGSWTEYFADPCNRFYDRDPGDRVFDIVPELAPLARQGRTLSLASFGKWGDQSRGLRAAVGEPHPRLVLAGVSAACCVWSTAVEAADAGAYVTIASDACAASVNEVRDWMWEHLQPPYKGLIQLASTEELLAAREGDGHKA